MSNVKAILPDGKLSTPIEEQITESNPPLLPSDEPRMLYNIVKNFPDGFTPEDVAKKYGYDPKSIQEFLLKFSTPFFSVYTEDDKNYSFAPTFNFIIKS